MKKLTLATVFLILSGFTMLRAQELSAIPGAFVDVGYGARPMGVGGAFVGLANDVHAVLWNPAGIANIENKQVGFSTHKQLGLISYNFVGFTMPYQSGLDGLGVAFIYSGDEALKEITIQASYARKVYKTLTVGASLKYRRASFGDNTFDEDEYIVFDPSEIALGKLNQVKGSGNGVGLDIGVLFDVTEKIKLGVMLKDIYAPVFWDSKVDNPDLKAKGSYSELVPFETVIGTSFRLFDELIVTADYNPAFTDDTFNKIRGGAEARLFKFLYIRAGIQSYVNNEDDEKIVFGTGLKFGLFGSKFIFDYSNVTETIANTSRLSVGFEF